jgi:hypothetical protein
MARKCSICQNHDRSKIDKLLASGSPIRGISRTFRVSEDALGRHKTHLCEIVTAAAEKRKERLGESVLDEVDRLKTKVWNMLEAAESERDRIGFTALTRELRQTLGAIFEIQNQAAKVQAQTEMPSVEIRIVDISAEPTTPATPRTLTE